ISGGEQQRVAIARGMVHRPTTLLADEPTANLDSRASWEVMQAFADLNNADAVTILVVTHDPFVASFCWRIVFIKDDSTERTWTSEKGFWFHLSPPE
ncbi:MAG: ATP-binding cassette domain-containing protein, partial [Firmicutes bacterium]|nr:ATP-binding cassette domain-containing protein [Bacillota bacterium]